MDVCSSASKSYNLFISYGRGDDIPFAERLYADLAEQGHKVWFDKESLVRNFVNVKEEVICSFFIMLLSRSHCNNAN